MAKGCLSFCCFGCDLQTGSLIILWFYAVSFTISIFVGLGYPGNMEMLFHSEKPVQNVQLRRAADGTLYYWINSSNVKITCTRDPTERALAKILLENAIHSLILAIPTYVAIYGGHTGVPNCMLPFLILDGLFTIISIIAYGILLPIALLERNWLRENIELQEIKIIEQNLTASLISIAVILGIRIYFFMVIYSHYANLKETFNRLEKSLREGKFQPMLTPRPIPSYGIPKPYYGSRPYTYPLQGQPVPYSNRYPYRTPYQHPQDHPQAYRYPPYGQAGYPPPISYSQYGYNPYPNQYSGYPQYQYGQPQNQYGQPQNQYGQPQNQYGQPPNQYAQPQDSPGQGQTPEQSMNMPPPNWPPDAPPKIQVQQDLAAATPAEVPAPVLAAVPAPAVPADPAAAAQLQQPPQ